MDKAKAKTTIDPRSQWRVISLVTIGPDDKYEVLLDGVSLEDATGFVEHFSWNTPIPRAIWPTWMDVPLLDADDSTFTDTIIEMMKEAI